MVVASQFRYQGKNEHLLKMGLQHHGVRACFQILLVTLSENDFRHRQWKLINLLKFA